MFSEQYYSKNDYVVDNTAPWKIKYVGKLEYVPDKNSTFGVSYIGSQFTFGQSSKKHHLPFVDFPKKWEYWEVLKQFYE